MEQEEGPEGLFFMRFIQGGEEFLWNKQDLIRFMTG